MYLKELTINGFKSFARKGDLEFSAPISAIVGPNGSGKSNIAESFRFVLGEQSVKAMRGKKGEDLIWGGSEKVSRGNRASVEVVFDNSKRTFALDFDEVKIERTVHRDGQNEYKVNNATVRLKDIHELLASANIGATGHHIISQGEADRILAASPKERREMIEDALGLKVYQLKKQDAERKLNKTSENIAHVESLRREASPHLRYLKKQVERAERSLQVQAELVLKYADYLKREDTYVAFHHDRLEGERREPASRLEEVKEQLAIVHRQLDSSTDNTLLEAERVAETTYKTNARERQLAEQQASALQGQIGFLQRRLAAPKSAPITDGVVPRTKVASALESAKETFSPLKANPDASALIQFVEALFASLNALVTTEAVESVDTTEADRAELNHLTSDYQAALKDVEHAAQKEIAAEAELKSARAAVDADTKKNHDAERDMFALREEQRTLELTLRDIDQALALLARDRDEFKRELQEAVTLIGRSASDYFNYTVLGSDGSPVSNETIVAEDRSEQIARRRELEKFKIRLEELGVGNTEELLKEYKEAEERDAFLQKELQDLSDSVGNLNALIADMQAKLQEQFVTGIEKISIEFNRFFTLMFGGGAASLAQVSIAKRRNEDDDDDSEPAETEEGVELSVSLPNKRVKGLNMLSGGERALTSIAAIFAMSQVNPPPFIILDETDAALDEANSRRYGDMIEELAKKSQLVLITHNRETMSRAGILYGITMGPDGVSKVLSVKFDEAAIVAK